MTPRILMGAPERPIPVRLGTLKDEVGWRWGDNVVSSA